MALSISRPMRRSHTSPISDDSQTFLLIFSRAIGRETISTEGVHLDKAAAIPHQMIAWVALIGCQLTAIVPSSSGGS